MVKRPVKRPRLNNEVPEELKEAERVWIAARRTARAERKRQSLGEAAAPGAAVPAPDLPPPDFAPTTNPGVVEPPIVGLSLSGGGIRSASFCLGGLQALDAAGRFECVDYLSTVSGGGYAGAALMSRLSLAAKAAAPTAQAKVGEGQDSEPTLPLPEFPLNAPDPRVDDSVAMTELRDKSNFLVPYGFTDYVADLGIVARGLVVNLIAVAGWMLVLLAAYLAVFGSREGLKSPWITAFIQTWCCPPTPKAEITKWPDLIGFWIQNVQTVLQRQDIAAYTLAGLRFQLTAIVGVAVLVLLCVYAFKRSKGGHMETFSGWSTAAGRSILVLILALFLDLQPILHNALADLWFPKMATAAAPGQESFWAALGSVVLTVATVVSGWLDNIIKKAKAVSGADTLIGRIKDAITTVLALSAYSLFGLVLPVLLWLIYSYILLRILPAGSPWRPDWLTLLGLAGAGGGLILLYRTLAKDPNANTLHGLYRGRLNDAFVESEEGILPLSQIAKGCGPYPIINTALNIPGSRFYNLRGRNAAFFCLTPSYSGSRETGYQKTSDYLLESGDEIDYGTAIAISGAAVSSYMGSMSNRMLAPTLALLNLRLGYWLKRPKLAADGTANAFVGGTISPIVREILGQIDETHDHLYLTDGGHLENLGMYELLRRKCPVIILFDGEQDDAMTYSALITLQRYARIDLGVRIDLPWAEMVGPTFVKDRMTACHGSVGLIQYSKDAKEDGILFYFKSSCTGDENDYLKDYRKRNPAFPHQNTGEQFFGEEQFEAYRALGFHAVFEALDGRKPLMVAKAVLEKMATAPVQPPAGPEMRILDAPTLARLGL